MIIENDDDKKKRHGEFNFISSFTLIIVIVFNAFYLGFTSPFSTPLDFLISAVTLMFFFLYDDFV